MASHIIDVRTNDEWQQGHVKNAIHWPLDKLVAGNFPGLEKQDEIILYCRSGNRSALAEILFKQEGYTNVSNIRTLQRAAEKGGGIITGQ